jgi:hypothetical protein
LRKLDILLSLCTKLLEAFGFELIKGGDFAGLLPEVREYVYEGEEVLTVSWSDRKEQPL